jgi:hypothetical protein
LEGVSREGLRLITAPLGFANLDAVVYHSLVDPDRKAAGWVNTSPDLVFQRRSAWTKVRKWDEYAMATFTTLRKIHAYRLL